MVKKLTVVIGVWLLSLFLFNSVTDGQDVFKYGSSNSPYFSSSSRGNGDFMTVEVPETSYSPVTPIRPSEMIYLMPVSHPYSELIEVNRRVLAYPYPNPIPYINRYPATTDSYVQGNIIQSLDQKIFALLEELSMVGLVVLFLIIRVFYTSWYRDNRLQNPSRWPF